jgi:hypothetical protein
MITTEYGSWVNLMGITSATLEDDVTLALGEFADEYDHDATCGAYRDEINAAMPEGVTLCGDVIYGPADGFRAFWAEIDELRDAIDAIDFWSLPALAGV